MPITDWPASERPREKLIERGAQSLSDAELLAIFLRTGIRGATAVDLARQLLSHFGSLGAMLSSSESQFCQAKGLGQAKYVQLQAVMELSRRHLKERAGPEEAASSSNAVKEYLQASLSGQERELFHVLFLDAQNKIIASETLFYGTLTTASVYPREIIKRVLELNAASLILAHNHPSGVSEPSQSDI
ncbi:UNVERIFIED_CONTAM: hypothetical protein GTU68_053760, partial [Idotea baltica]|nr:hypothetical protein [Idotea baltica]